jgi:hypothetical protein
MTVSTFVLVLFLNNGGLQHINASPTYADCMRTKHAYTELYRKNKREIPKMDCVQER